MLNFYWLLKLSDLEMFVIGQVKSDSLDLKQPIKPLIRAVNNQSYTMKHFVIDTIK